MHTHSVCCVVSCGWGVPVVPHLSVFFVPRTLSPDTETLSLDRTRASGTSHETANSQYGKGYPVRPYGVRYGRESDPPSHTRHITAHASRGVHHVYVPHHVPRPTTSHYFTSHYVPHYCTVYVPLLPTTSHYVPQCHYAPPPSAGRGRAVSVAVRLYQRPTATRRTRHSTRQSPMSPRRANRVTSASYPRF